MDEVPGLPHGLTLAGNEVAWVFRWVKEALGVFCWVEEGLGLSF